MVFVFLWLAYFTFTSGSPGPSILLQRVNFSSFLLLSRIPLCKGPIVVLSLAIVNNAAMNMGVLLFFQISVLSFFRYILRSKITGLRGRSIHNFFRYLHTAFHSGCTNLHSHQQCRNGTPFSTSSPALLACWFIGDSHSHRCEMISHYGFNLHFPEN